MTMEGTATKTNDGGYLLSFERHFDHPIEKVWKAISRSVRTDEVDRGRRGDRRTARRRTRAHVGTRWHRGNPSRVRTAARHRIRVEDVRMGRRTHPLGTLRRFRRDEAHVHAPIPAARHGRARTSHEEDGVRSGHVRPDPAHTRRLALADRRSQRDARRESRHRRMEEAPRELQGAVLHNRPIMGA